MSTLRRVYDRVGLVGIGAITLGLIVLANLIFYLGLNTELTRDKGRTVTIDFPHSLQLQTTAPVRVNGMDVGQVDEVSSLPGDRGAKVTVDVSDDAGPLYRDASAHLRWRLLLGGTFYVQLDPGTPGRPPLGDHTIPMGHTSTQVQLDDVSKIFTRKVQKGLRTLPRQLSVALSDPHAPARALDTLADVSPDVTAGLKAAQGRPGSEDLTRLVRGAASTMRALNAAPAALRKLVAGAGATVQAVAQRNAQLQDALTRGPQTMSSIHDTLARLQPTLTGVDGLVSRLQRSASQVAPTLRRLHPTLTDTAVLLDKARPLLHSLRPAVRRLASAAQAGVPVIDRVRPSVKRLDDTILPYLGAKDPVTGKSTTVMIGGTAAGFGGSAGEQDANGHMIRFPATVGDASVYLPCRLFADPSHKKLVTCNSLQTDLRDYLKYLPGAPGQEGKLPQENSIPQGTP